MEAPQHPDPPALPEDNLSPSYVLEDIVVRGNRKTDATVILAELQLRAGDVVTASDHRVEASRFRLLSLGYFLDVRMSLQRGSRRGGAVLLIEVEERGTIILNNIHLGTSDATAFWGGLEASQMNAFGRGIVIGGGFVASTTPRVENAEATFAGRLRASFPARVVNGVSFSATGLFNHSSEFFRARGGDGDPDPAGFTALRLRRAGAVLGLGRELSRNTRLYLDYRWESLHADLPGTRTHALGDGTIRPIDFAVHQGSSNVGTVTFSVDVDTRSDPVLPHSGVRLLMSIELGSAMLGSDYDFAKGLVQASVYLRMPRGHVLGLHSMAGAIFGGAPYFDRFFIGDLNMLLPPRALGVNFSTQPSRNLLGFDAERHRYDNLATRVVAEYAIPLWRRHRIIYGGDAFAAFGAFALASLDDLRVRDRGLTHSLPIDLTADLGVRLDTAVGIFTISFGNTIGRLPF